MSLSAPLSQPVILVVKKIGGITRSSSTFQCLAVLSVVAYFHRDGRSVGRAPPNHAAAGGGPCALKKVAFEAAALSLARKREREIERKRKKALLEEEGSSSSAGRRARPLAGFAVVALNNGIGRRRYQPRWSISRKRVGD